MSIVAEILAARQRLLDNGAKDDFVVVLNNDGYRELIAETGLEPLEVLAGYVQNDWYMDIAVNSMAGQEFYVFERRTYLRLFYGGE
jgi:hypothetical protein